MVAASVKALFDTSNGDMPVVNCRIAAELRAIAEELQSHLDKYFADGDAVLLEVLNWLDAEADRAEAGE